MKAFRTGQGVTLIETMIAILVALIGVLAVGNVVFQATVTNKNQGAETTRAVIYAQDKMEELLALGGPGAISTTVANWNTCSQSTPPSPCNTTGITDASWTVTGLIEGGPISPTTTTTAPAGLDCPAAEAAGPTATGYMDFLNKDGQQIQSATCSSVAGTQIAYVREWAITDLDSTTNPANFPGGQPIKQITVAVYSALAVNTAKTGTVKPIVVLTGMLSDPN